MSRRRHRRTASPFARSEEPRLNISPLIDVAFLLLIYFLVTTTLARQEADLSLALPGVTRVESDPVPVDQMRIEIDPAGAVLVNREVTDPDPSRREVPVLTDRLVRYEASARIAGARALVVIHCDDAVPEQRFIDVLNACARAGIAQVSLLP